MSYAPFFGKSGGQSHGEQRNLRVRADEGDHAILRWVPPDHHDAEARTVSVPLHDELSEGTLREIGKQAGMKDFQEFKSWIDRNQYTEMDFPENRNRVARRCFPETTPALVLR